ncbi:hypothetical protein CHELA41_24485 [Hyphomicrobiales bacterium]|nr:hypothetical protein CHELA41_24485 [Hyphomicrobiales bacterium]
MDKMDANLNVAQCMKEISNIGHTVVRNVCTGAEAVVPWGTLDWIGILFIVGAFVLFVGIFTAIAREIW